MSCTNDRYYQQKKRIKLSRKILGTTSQQVENIPGLVNLCSTSSTEKENSNFFCCCYCWYFALNCKSLLFLQITSLLLVVLSYDLQPPKEHWFSVIDTLGFFSLRLFLFLFLVFGEVVTFKV